MKALEFLKDMRENTTVEWKELDEAIAELEALENRNCRNCKHSWEPNNQVIFRFYCEEIKTRTHGYFYCNRWEAKQ